MGKRRQRPESEIERVLREAVRDAEAAGASQRSIAIGAGIDPAQLFRFVECHRTMTLPAAGALADYLGCRLVRRKPAKRVRKPAIAIGAGG